MADNTEDKVHCPVCEYEVGTKENGTKIKAHKVNGEKCDGSDTELIDILGVDAGDTFEDAPWGDENASQGDEQSDREENSGDDSSAPEMSAQADTVFTHIIKVHEACPYLSDPVWHAANGRLVATEAKKAGRVVGGEASFKGINPAGDDRIHLIYTIPVL